MKRLWRVLLIVSALTLTGCTAALPGSVGPNDPDQLRVVTSFTIIEDMVQAIGGDLVTVHNLVPTGTDPHDYDPLPDDIRAATDADLLLSNGLNLEGGDDGWFARLATAAQQPADRVVEAAGDISPRYLGEGESDAQVNPHAFADPAAAIVMAETIRDTLMRVDPSQAPVYASQGEAYIAEIEAIQHAYAEQLGRIPLDQRVLVTSERAFQYLAATYDLTERFIWEIDTDENGSVQQIIALAESLRAHPVPFLVIESNKDSRPMEMVSAEIDIPIYPVPIYSDEIGGSPQGGPGTYLGYLEHNLEVLTGALG